MSEIQRYDSTARLSRTVVHNGVAYLAGITSSELDGDITVQAKSVFEIIDARLARIGSSKEKILSAEIWLQNIDRDFASFNAAWEDWISPDATPARATCEAKLAASSLLVEIIIVAAL